MRRREFVTLLGGAAAAWPLAARAQQLRLAQIGVLVLTNADGQSLTRELRLGLRDLGYSEGQNFVFQLRSSDGDAARVPQLATDLVSAQVDVIVAPFTPMRSGCKASDNNHSNRDGRCCGPYRCRTGDELGASRWQHHRLFQHGRRNGRKKRGTVPRYAALDT